MNFNPNEHLTDIKGKPYLPVAQRIVWAREERPDMQFKTEIIKYNDDMAIVRCTLIDAAGQVLATAHKKETKQGFADYLEKAETGSIGRSLAMIGYGTQFAPEFEEGERLADAPVGTKRKSTPIEKEVSGESNLTSQGDTSKTESKPLKKGDMDTKAGQAVSSRYFAVAEKAGVPRDKAEEFAKSQFNLKSYNDISVGQLTKLIKSMEKRASEINKTPKDEIEDILGTENDFESLIESEGRE